MVFLQNWRWIEKNRHKYKLRPAYKKWDEISKKYQKMAFLRFLDYCYQRKFQFIFEVCHFAHMFSNDFDCLRVNKFQVDSYWCWILSVFRFLIRISDRLVVKEVIIFGILRFLLSGATWHMTPNEFDRLRVNWLNVEFTGTELWVFDSMIL